MELCDVDDQIPITGLIIRNSKMDRTYRHSTKEFGGVKNSAKLLLGFLTLSKGRF
jgi:hypothetical protein